MAVNYSGKKFYNIWPCGCITSLASMGSMTSKIIIIILQWSTQEANGTVRLRFATQIACVNAT
jgi:hypothetical protein